MNLPCARIQNALINQEPVTFDEDLMQHLGQCSACAARLTAQQGISRALKQAIANDDAAPAALRIRIRHQLYRPKTRWQRVASWFDSFNQSRLVVAVAASMLIFMLGAGLIYKQMSSRSAEITHFDHSVTVPEHNARVLKIGWGNHMHCAVNRDYSSGPRSFEHMAQALGDEWIELVDAVKSHVPTDYRVMIAHRCKLQGREFIHLILSNSMASAMMAHSTPASTTIPHTSLINSTIFTATPPPTSLRPEHCRERECRTFMKITLGR